MTDKTKELEDKRKAYLYDMLLRLAEFSRGCDDENRRRLIDELEDSLNRLGEDGFFGADYKLDPREHDSPKFFVLRLDEGGDESHVEASREALERYSNETWGDKANPAHRLVCEYPKF